MATYGAAVIRQLVETHDGDPWYGTPRAALLRQVDHDQAAAEPVSGAHSVWGLVLHMTSWTNEVRRRLAGHEPSEPEAGDWPAVGEVTAERWAEAQAALTRAHQQLIAELEAMPEERWHQRVGRVRQPALGTGVDV